MTDREAFASPELMARRIGNGYVFNHPVPVTNASCCDDETHRCEDCANEVVDRMRRSSDDEDDGFNDDLVENDADDILGPPPVLKYDRYEPKQPTRMPGMFPTTNRRPPGQILYNTQMDDEDILIPKRLVF